MEGPKFDLIDGVLYFEYPSSPRKWSIVVPRHLRQILLEESHSGHFQVILPREKSTTTFTVTIGGKGFVWMSTVTAEDVLLA